MPTLDNDVHDINGSFASTSAATDTTCTLERIRVHLAWQGGMCHGRLFWCLRFLSGSLHALIHGLNASVKAYRFPQQAREFGRCQIAALGAPATATDLRMTSLADRAVVR